MTATGGITDTAAADLGVTGLANLNAGSAAITLGAGTLNFGTLTFNSAGAVVISEDSRMDIVGVNTAGSANLDSTAGDLGRGRDQRQRQRSGGRERARRSAWAAARSTPGR